MDNLLRRLALLTVVFFATLANASPSADDLLQACEDSYLQQDYANALSYGKEALPLCEGTDMEADCLNLLAMICFRQSDFEQAIVYAQQCYRLDAKSGDPDVMSSSLNTLAGIYIGANQPKEAERYILQAIKLAQKVDNPARMAVLQGTASEVYHALGNDREALKHIDTACDIEKQLGRNDKLAVRLTQKASVLIGLHRYAEAEQILSESIPVLKSVGDYHSLGIADNKIGMAILQQGRAREAVPYYREAASIFLQMGDLTNEMHARRGLYESLWKSNPDSAKIELERFDLLKDSLYSNATAEMTARYNAEFGLEQLKKENAQHREESARHKVHIRWIVIGVALLLLAIALMVWRMLRKPRTESAEDESAEVPDVTELPQEKDKEEEPVASADRQFIDKVDAIIKSHQPLGSITMEELASEMCITRGQLNRRIKNITGETTQHYVQNLRLEQARHLLQTTQMSVSEIGYRCGFEDATSFSRAFKRSFGQSPTQYKNEPKNA